MKINKKSYFLLLLTIMIPMHMNGMQYTRSKTEKITALSKIGLQILISSAFTAVSIYGIQEQIKNYKLVPSMPVDEQSSNRNKIFIYGFVSGVGLLSSVASIFDGLRAAYNVVRS
jgi:hypothetical protein